MEFNKGSVDEVLESSAHEARQRAFFISPKATILMVDDDRENLFLLSEYLNDYEFETILAHNGEEGLNLAINVLPDVILMDVMMPKLGGFDTCLRLKANDTTRDIPVIFMTAMSRPEDKVKGFEVGGVDYVTKPVQVNELLARVRVHLALKKAQSQLVAQNQRLEREIEERKLTEEALMKAHTDLAAANKELEAFSYSVSHDLRAPLRTVTAFAQALLRKEGFLDSEGLGYLQQIQIATDRMGQLINDLLKLSRISRREMVKTEVNLSSIANEIVYDLTDSSPERDVSFSIQDAVWVKGDAGLLRIVLENLLGNAWKFTAKNDQACIKFGMALLTDGREAFYVLDDGAGFDMEYVNKLFTPFQRLHSENDFEGTGIGLATVQRIIHRHCGRVWVEAALNQGATFYFTVSDS